MEPRDVTSTMCLGVAECWALALVSMAVALESQTMVAMKGWVCPGVGAGWGSESVLLGHWTQCLWWGCFMECRPSVGSLTALATIQRSN